MTAPITDVAGVGPATAAVLARHGIQTIPELATVSEMDLAAIPEIGPGRGRRLIAAARTSLSQGGAVPEAVGETKGGPDEGEDAKKKGSKKKKGRKGKKKNKKDKKNKNKKKDKKKKDKTGKKSKK